MWTATQLSPERRKRPAPPLPSTTGPLQEPVPDNTHAPRLPVVLDALPNSIVIDSTMKNLVRWDETLQYGLRPKHQESADAGKLPGTLATKVSAPVWQPGTNDDKETLHTVRQQVQRLEQQEGEINTMSDTHIQESAPADESPLVQLLQEIQQQQVEMQAASQQQIRQRQADILAVLQQQHEQHQINLLAALQQQHEQHQADILAALHQPTQQQQSVQSTVLGRRELELLQAARMQDGERYRDSMALLDEMMAMLSALRERASESLERSQKLTMRERELRGKLGSKQMM